MAIRAIIQSMPALSLVLAPNGRPPVAVNLSRVADEQVTGPDHTAVRVALWRAMHALVDAPPHVIEDLIGLRLADPPDGWRERPDMDPVFTSGFRGSIVARARFI